MFSSSPCHTPLLSSNPVILFFCRLWEATVWTNLVFLSPLWYHNDFDLYFHIADSRSRSSLISLCRLWMLTASSWRVLRFSRHWRFVCFSLICFLRLPKTFLLHHWSWFWQFFILSWVELFSPNMLAVDRANSTTSGHLSSLAHIDSKWNWAFTTTPSLQRGKVQG